MTSSRQTGSRRSSQLWKVNVSAELREDVSYLPHCGAHSVSPWLHNVASSSALRFRAPHFFASLSATFVQMSARSTTLLLFDVDGTLTKPRLVRNENIWWRFVVYVGLNDCSLRMQTIGCTTFCKRSKGKCRSVMWVDLIWARFKSNWGALVRKFRFASDELAILV